MKPLQAAIDHRKGEWIMGNGDKGRRTTGKRGNNEGSIYKRADGRWTAAITLPGGKRKAFYGKTRNEVAKQLTKALRDKDQGLPIVPEKQTVARFLADWLEATRPTIRGTNFTRYEEYARLHIAPALGTLKLAMSGASGAGSTRCTLNPR